MSPRGSSAALVDPLVSSAKRTDPAFVNELEAAALVAMGELGITAENANDTVDVDVDFDTYARWLETGEGPEPGARR